MLCATPPGRFFRTCARGEASAETTVESSPLRRISYFLISPPPSDGFCHVTRSSPEPTCVSLAETPYTRAGTLYGLFFFDAYSDHPALFSARTWNVYSTPLRAFLYV